MQIAAEQNKKEQTVSVEQIKRQYLDKMAGEFYTAITLILEPVRQVLQHSRDKAMMIKLRNVEKNGQRLIALIKQLPDVLDMEQQLLKPDLCKANLTDIIRPIYQSFFISAEEKNIKLNFRADSDIPPFYFDQRMVESIAQYLLFHAIQDAPAGGKVELSIEQLNEKLPEGTKPQIIIRVKNTNAEIKSQSIINFPHYFAKIETESSEIMTEKAHIMLAKAWTAAHGGKIIADNTPNGETIISAWLPFCNTLPQDPAISTIPLPDQKDVKADSTASNGTGPTDIILVVESDTMMRQFIREILLSKNYHIIEAVHAEDGIDKAIKLLPDLIIIDLMMPGKEGNDLMTALKNHKDTQNIPIIALTANSTIESKIQILKMGVDLCLTKPFFTEELLAYSERLLLNHKKLSKYDFSTAQKHILPPVKTATGEKKIDNFIQKLSLIVEQNLHNESLGVNELAIFMEMSRTQLYRKIRTLTNQNVLDFIRNYRLDRAKYLLLNQEGNVNEVAQKTGFSSTKHFSRVFKERFGVSPGAIKQHIDT